MQVDQELMSDIEELTASLIKRVDPEVVFNDSFPQQINFIKDPAKLKTLFCTRRAAKSFTAGMYMVHEALKTPNSNCLFIGLTRDSAKGIIWKDVLQVLDYKFNLGAKSNLAELTMTFPNGSVIKCLGVDADQDEMNKLLGKKYKLVCIDEASMYTIDLEKLVYGILKPAMADQRGSICLMGTSSNFTRGLFYDITTGSRRDWSVHSWSAYDNPHVSRQWAEELEEIERDRPLFKETPLFKQWYLNQWVVDTEKLVYKFNSERNTYQKTKPQLDPSGWTYILGVDTGWDDDNAFVLGKFHEHDPTFYVCKTFNKPHMTFDQVAAKIEEFMADPEMKPAKIIIDGANKQGVESMRQRSLIPFEYADKIGKVDFIEMLNGDLVQEKVKIHSGCTNLINELMGLVWKTDGDKIIYPKKEHPALPNHLCDAFLYAWRNGFHYMSQPAEKKLVVGSREWYEKNALVDWEKEREKMIESNNAWPAEGEWSNFT
jgi:phage terminase large subunit